MKIVQYKVIDELSQFDLARIVQNHIGLGWQPYGSISCFSSGYNQSNAHYVQAMVKYEP